MGWITEIVNRSQDVPISAALRERLHIPKRKSGDYEEEREQLLVKIEKLTATNNALMRVAELDPEQQDDRLSEQEVEILQITARESEVTARDISDCLEINLARAEYQLSQLLENEYLVDSALLDHHAYLLDGRGREYLMLNGQR